MQSARFSWKPCISGCRTGMGQLCTVCDSIVRRSSILTGSLLLSGARKEHCTHHSTKEIKVFATRCDLCDVLLSSIRIISQLPCVRDSSEAPQPDFHSVESELEVQIWNERRNFKSQKSFIRLTGNTILDSTCLIVEEGQWT